MSEQAPLKVSARQYQEQINRGEIVNPVSGVVLTKYALKGEITAIGKPLYKIANIDTLFLKAYLTGDKLSQIRLGQQVSIRIDQGEKDYKSYQGIITWISAKSEFTPKTIQTKNERANLVYAFKVRVKNDGYLKIGMYGEVILNKAQEQK
ncbi:HlyD family secretion protein [Pseudarcicella hirudinis]|uniref:HlyD family secretion protein n=1 Tax=Pseudarcicella hirudinis TaxID=1079859 RepID=UPI0035EB3BD4